MKDFKGSIIEKAVERELCTGFPFTKKVGSWPFVKDIPIGWSDMGKIKAIYEEGICEPAMCPVCFRKKMRSGRQGEIIFRYCPDCKVPCLVGGIGLPEIIPDFNAAFVPKDEEESSNWIPFDEAGFSTNETI